MNFKISTVCVFMMLVAGQAHAFDPGNGCNLKKTKDGFVALRKGPSTSSKLIHKLTTAHFVSPGHRGEKWISVFAHKYGEEGDQPNAFYKKGYVHTSLINWNDCFYLP